ncbi:MAG: hypothetical protein JWO05_1587 [Gemmatimonadetes bacterium]|nr:hypothetical protein [Gemmatimonadota bacterium]
MAQLNTKQYDALEMAIRDGSRIVIFRRGSEFIVIPLAIRLKDSREMIEARHPTTGHSMTLFLDEVDSLDVVR